MKAALLNDEGADLNTVPENYRPKLKLKYRPDGSIASAVYPKDTVFDGEHAAFLVSTGQARPIDEECRASCKMTPEQLASKQVSYEMDSKGIHSEKDRQLYKAGVILGYDENLEYIHGPNWAQHEAAQKELEKEDEI